MDEEITISSFLADDTKSESSTSEKSEKERSELIFEVKTICNVDTLVQNCKLLKSNTLTFSSETDHSQQCNVGFPVNTGTHFCFRSEPNEIISHNRMKLNRKEGMNEFSLRYTPENKSFILPEKSFEGDDSCTTEEEPSAVLEREVKEMPQTDNKESDSNPPDNKEKYQEYQLSTDSSDMLDDIKRSSRRNSKRKKDFDGFCPICGVTVRLNDLESHYNQEVDKLSKISRCSKKMHLEEIPKNEAFDLVRKNRENRLTARVARYSAKAKNEVKCPVCSLRMSGTAEEINKHVAFCIQDEDSDVDVDGDDGSESFEEYEIGDETRIRPISLVPGGYRSLHGDAVRQTAEDEDLNVDVDDTIAYGDPQYSEIDVIPDTSSEQDRSDLEQLRKAVAVDSLAQPQNVANHKWSKKDIGNSESSKSVTDTDPVISSLKEKIKALEDQDKNVRCLICLESYTKPVVSTTCWHVHCEECWLMTMGVKKLCPQCNMIVFPSDLRKIYI